MILKCDCTHRWSDRAYGAGMRVMNECTKKEDKSQQKYRCVVCGKERGADRVVKVLEVVVGDPINAGSRGAQHERAAAGKRGRR